MCVGTKRGVTQSRGVYTTKTGKRVTCCCVTCDGVNTGGYISIPQCANTLSKT
jgi:hypothetical protein